jgi:hypothetical protein
MSERIASVPAEPRRTLKAPAAALARVQKAIPVTVAGMAPPPVQHAVDKSPKSPASAQPKPVVAQPPPIEVDPDRGSAPGPSRAP